MPLFRFPDGRLARLSEDKTICRIDPSPMEIEENATMEELLGRMVAAWKYNEVLTTKEMLFRALEEIPDDEVIELGVSPKDNNGASVVRIERENGAVILLAGRVEIE